LISPSLAQKLYTSPVGEGGHHRNRFIECGFRTALLHHGVEPCRELVHIPWPRLRQPQKGLSRAIRYEVANRIESG
jgi:hypothetical protein